MLAIRRVLRQPPEPLTFPARNMLLSVLFDWPLQRNVFLPRRRYQLLFRYQPNRQARCLFGYIFLLPRQLKKSVLRYMVLPRILATPKKY
jgi:hypothetical protein